MFIDALTASTGAGAATGGAEGPAKAPQQEFLKLLVAQLENQNPLDPQDGSEFVAQLAQFASLEQSAETNERLGALQAEQAGAANATLTSFVGHSVTVNADNIAISDDATSMPDLQVQLGGAATKTEVIIRDAAGNEVRRLTVGPSPAGTVAAPWDGLDSRGVKVPPGSYHVEVNATAADGTTVAAQARMRGVVDAIDFIAGAALLRIGAVSIAPGDVVSVR